MPTRFVQMDIDQFESQPTPPDDLIGTFAYVTAIANRSGFMAYARVNAAGDNEWYREGDEFQAEVASLQALTNLGAGDTNFGNTFSVDLTDYDSVMFRLRCTAAGVTGRVRLRYTINSVDFFDLSSEFVILDSTGIKEVVWDNLPSGAKAPIILIGTAYNGNGTEDPQVITFVAHFRR